MTIYAASITMPLDINNRDGYPSAWKAYEKGLTLPPFRLSHTDGGTGVKVTFEKTELARECQCSISCEVQGTESVLGPFCPADKGHEVLLTDQSFLTDRATLLTFSFTDGKGNTSSFDIPSLVKTVPLAPLVSEVTELGQTRIEVGIPVLSSAFIALPEATQYQVQSYTRNPQNAKTWVDWRDIEGAPSLWFMNPVLGLTYGFRVRFRCSTDHASPWSAWTTVTPAGS